MCGSPKDPLLGLFDFDRDGRIGAAEYSVMHDVLFHDDREEAGNLGAIDSDEAPEDDEDQEEDLEDSLDGDLDDDSDGDDLDDDSDGDGFDDGLDDSSDGDDLEEIPTSEVLMISEESRDEDR